MSHFFVIVAFVNQGAISLVVEQRSPKPLVWVRFLHRPQKMFIMPKTKKSLERDQLNVAMYCKEKGTMILKLAPQEGGAKHRGVQQALMGLLSKNAIIQAKSVMLLKSIPDRGATQEIRYFLSFHDIAIPTYIKEKVREALLGEIKLDKTIKFYKKRA